MAMRSYDNMTIVPNVVSDIVHRGDVNTGVDCFGIHLDVPMIAAPMPDVCNGKMAGELAVRGGLGIIHRFQTIDSEVSEFKLAYQYTLDAFEREHSNSKNIACSIGTTGDFQERFSALYDAGCRIFCIDTANGANITIESSISLLKSYADVYIIAGNVATWTGYKYLANLGVHGIRTGIAGGAVCETRNETGVYLPTLESVCRITEHSNYRRNRDEMPIIIADGGIRRPADMNLALACGADLIMGGSLFAGYNESPGLPFNENGVLYKLYRGAASFGVQLEAKGDEPDYVEGRETRILYKRGGVRREISRYKAGLQSSMSYMGALNLTEFRENVTVEKL